MTQMKEDTLVLTNQLVVILQQQLFTSVVDHQAKYFHPQTLNVFIHVALSTEIFQIFHTSSDLFASLQCTLMQGGKG